MRKRSGACPHAESFPLLAAGLVDAADEAVLRSSLVCLIITSSSQQSLHPSLTEARGSHLIQGFVRLQTPDQVALRSRAALESLAV